MTHPTDDPRRSRRSSARRDGLALIGGLGFGVVAALGVGVFRDRGARDPVVYSPDERVVTLATFTDLGPGAATPDEAIDRFLAAEMDGDAEASLALLSASDRVDIPTINSWERARRSRIGQIVAVSTLELDTTPGDGVAVATTTLELVPSLDSINGLTPPSATAEWQLVEDRGWRIDLGASALTPDYLHSLDTGAAETAAQDWLAAGTACDPFEAAGGHATFRGSAPNLTDELCALAAGDAETIVGPPAGLDSAAAADGLTASFGSSIRDWASVVPVFEPVRADLVLAPIGDRWVVIDVLSP